MNKGSCPALIGKLGQHAAKIELVHVGTHRDLLQPCRAACAHRMASASNAPARGPLGVHLTTDGPTGGGAHHNWVKRRKLVCWVF